MINLNGPKMATIEKIQEDLWTTNLVNLDWRFQEDPCIAHPPSPTRGQCKIKKIDPLFKFSSQCVYFYNIKQEQCSYD